MTHAIRSTQHDDDDDGHGFRVIKRTLFIPHELCLPMQCKSFSFFPSSIVNTLITFHKTCRRRLRSKVLFFFDSKITLHLAGASWSQQQHTTQHHYSFVRSAAAAAAAADNKTREQQQQQQQQQHRLLFFLHNNGKTDVQGLRSAKKTLSSQILLGRVLKQSTLGLTLANLLLSHF